MAGSSPLACFQCGKCGAGCPLKENLDLTPSQIMHLVRLDQEEAVLGCKSIWLCASCETCTTRCPQDVDIARVMDACRGLAFHRGVKPGVPSVASFYKATYGNLKKFGRMFEAMLLASLKMRTGEYTKDMELGMDMLKKGKLSMLPSFARVFQTRAIFKKAMKIERERAKK
jgi:heterodisulfide reductase subunit C